MPTPLVSMLEECCVILESSRGDSTTRRESLARGYFGLSGASPVSSDPTRRATTPRSASSSRRRHRRSLEDRAIASPRSNPSRAGTMGIMRWGPLSAPESSRLAACRRWQERTTGKLITGFTNDGSPKFGYYIRVRLFVLDSRRKGHIFQIHLLSAVCCLFNSALRTTTAWKAVASEHRLFEIDRR